ncbi:MAG: hypothetical protein ACRDX9_00725 [Acidimicrobiia bacterium]
MIDPQVLSQRASSGAAPTVIDHRGEHMALQWLSEDVPMPGLLVARVNEAVKQAESGRVVHHLNRDELWAVEGFVLDAEVLRAIPEGEYSAHDLMAAVVAAGYRWRVVEMSAGPDLPGTYPL